MNTTNRLTQIVGHLLKYRKKGMIFSTDALISFVIALFGLVLFVNTLNNYYYTFENQLEQFELEEKALLIADSFVKNFDSNNAILGACYFDNDKKRVKTNELSKSLIKNAKTLEVGDIFVKSIEYKTKMQNEKIMLSAKKEKDCVNTKRFVLIDGEKGIIQILICTEG